MDRVGVPPDEGSDIIEEMIRIFILSEDALPD